MNCKRVGLQAAVVATWTYAFKVDDFVRYWRARSAMVQVRARSRLPHTVRRASRSRSRRRRWGRRHCRQLPHA